MPRTWDRRRYTYLASTFSPDNPNNPPSFNYAEAESLVAFIDKPSTIRRVKPGDLFAEATPRFVYSAKWAVIRNSSRFLYDNGYYNVNIAPQYPADDFDSGIATGIDFGKLDNKLLAKIKDSTVNTATFVAELGKTCDMVTKLARDVVKAFRSIRSGRAIKAVVKQLKHPTTRNGRKAAEKWLEHNYGWTPLMSDIDGLSNQLIKKFKDTVPIYVSVSDKIDLHEHGFVGANYISKKYTGNIKMRARFRVGDPGLKYLSEIGLTNPALLVWELVPYSFVVDWVYDVSSVLSGLDALVGIRDLTYHRNYGYDMVWSRQNYQRIVAPGWIQTGIGEDVGIQSVRSRSGALHNLVPSFPRYDPHVSVKRMLSAAALLRTIFR